MWTCDKCGSEKIMQEWAFYAPMNSESTPRAELDSDDLRNAFANDYYWCEDCEEDCSPIDSKINSLHKDYIPE